MAVGGARPGTAGATRICPHCRQTILESSVVCPACRHHLKSTSSKTEARAANTTSALLVEGTVEHPPVGEPWEYSVLVIIRDEKGAEIARHVANVGALTAGMQRSFTLSVEVFKG